MTVSLHLVSDLDGTWIPSEGNTASLESLEAFLEANPGIVLTFATGRTLSSALRALSGLVKIWPCHFITDVGTAIYHLQKDGRWVEDSDYSAWVKSRWNSPFLNGPIEGWLPFGVRRQINVFAPRRLALEVEPGQEVQFAAEELRMNLAKIGLVADVLATGRCLDVLPVGVNKGTAAEFLQTHFSLPRPMVACGDSENDIGLFQVADLAVLMADSPLNFDFPGMPKDRVHRSSTIGPMGILEVLLSLTTDHAGVR